jgi:hypothetical protein
MTRALEFSGVVTNGKLPKDISERIGSVISGMEGKRLVVAIREQKKRRSLQANAYLWAAVYPPIVAMFRDAGNMVDDEDVHAYLKEHVGKLSQILVLPDGEVVKIPGSTSKLTTTEFQDYIAKVSAWAAEFGVGVPLPHEQFQQPIEEKVA